MTPDKVEELKSISFEIDVEGDIPMWVVPLKDTIEALTQELQKAREASYFKGYNAGLADGTNKPLLAIEQMLQKAREEERERIKKIVMILGTKNMANGAGIYKMLYPNEIIKAIDHSKLDHLPEEVAKDWNKQAENLMNGLPANDHLPDRPLNSERE